jgi:hypothetical protein
MGIIKKRIFYPCKNFKGRSRRLCRVIFPDLDYKLCAGYSSPWKNPGHSKQEVNSEMENGQIPIRRSRVLAEELPMREMNSRKVIISMVDGTVFRGYTNIGTSRRLSDFFRKSENVFLVLFDSSIGNGTGKDVYFINKDHIVWAAPDENASDMQDDSEPTIVVGNGPRI